MLTLYLDGQPADLLATQQVKITTKAARAGQATASFTLEITLPLTDSTHNQALLPLAGYATHHKQAWQGKRWRAHLLSDGHTIMRGVATLTKLTEHTASVQLLGGGAIFSHATAGADKLYIDELPLGWAYDDLTFPDWTKASKEQLSTPPNASEFINKCFNDDAWNARLTAHSDHTPAVFFPTQNEDDTQRANPMAVFAVDNGKDGVHTRWGFCIAYRNGRVPISTLGQPAPLWAHYGRGLEDELQQIPAVQPYLAFIIERILWAIGLDLRPSDNALRQLHGLKNLFIANGRHTLSYAEALPHWTVKEFFDHLQTYLGLTLFVTLDGRVRLEGAFSEEVHPLHQVTDHYTCDLSASDSHDKDRSLATHYTHTWGIPEHNLHADLYALTHKSLLTTTPTPTDEGALHTIYFAPRGEEGVPSAERFAYVKRGHEYRFETIDLLGAKVDAHFQRLTHTPANIAPATIHYTAQHRLKGDHLRGSNERYAKVWLLKRERTDFDIAWTNSPMGPYNLTIEAYGANTHFPLLATRMQVGPQERTYGIELATLITQANPDLPRDTPHDTLSLAINTHGIAPHRLVSLETIADVEHLAEQRNNRAFPEDLLCGVNPDVPHHSRPFSLYHIPTPTELRSDASTTIGYLHSLHAKAVERRGGLEYYFSFIEASLPNPDNIFLIKGRRYGCLSLEATYTHHGLKQPIEGRFYELVNP